MAVKESQRPPRSVRDNSPCAGCTERFLACSDRCPKDERGEFGYMAWKAEIQSVKNAQKAYNSFYKKRKWVQYGIHYVKEIE